MIVGVPSNDFGSQEPGGAREITQTAHDEYHVSFPLTEKVAVKGKDAHPFYKWAALERPLEAPRWNFHKYLIDRSGTRPDGPFQARTAGPVCRPSNRRSFDSRTGKGLCGSRSRQLPYRRYYNAPEESFP
jgi:hypothetical protein